MDEFAPVLSGPKRQHFLPRFYLEGFTRDGGLAVYDREKNEVRLQTPNATGVIGHFYTFEDVQGRKRFDIEKMFSDQEGRTAPVVKKLAARETITDEERGELSVFMALAVCRTPEHLDSLKFMNGEVIKKIARFMFSDTERVKNIINERGDDSLSGEELEKEANKLIEFAQSDRYVVETHHQWALGMALKMHNSIANILAARDWLVLHRPTEKLAFITTDAPCVLTTTAPRENQLYGVGFANRDALTVFPLTSSCALLIHGKDAGLRHTETDRENIRGINLMLAASCQRFVIARDEALVKSLTQYLGLANKKWNPKMQVG